MIAKTRIHRATPETKKSATKPPATSRAIELPELDFEPDFKPDFETGIAIGTSPTSTDNLPFSWFAVVSLIVAAAVVLPWDVSLAKFFMSDPLPGELRSLIHKTEFFGHAYGILGIAFTIYLVSELRRRQLLRLLCTAFAAGIACDVVKVLFHRVRPVDFSFAANEATFKGLSFLHVESFGQLFDSSLHSFPSAHTATAVAFALALGRMFPKAAKWFLVLAGMCAVSRFDGGAHFVSDTLIGGLLGYVVAVAMLGSRTRVGRWFSSFERADRTEPASAWAY